MSKRKAEQPHPADEPPRPASLRRSARLHSAAAAIASEQQQPSAAAVASAGAPFRRLATVELQLIMQHCDLSTLLALARCSRCTLSAASHPFAWRSLSPLSIQASQISDLRGSRLLVHCDVALRWVPAIKEQPYLAVDDAELAAIESVPRLVQLNCCGRNIDSSAPLLRLLSHPALGGLTALYCCRSEMDTAGMALLPLHQPRLRTLSLGVLTDDASGNSMLTPLSQMATLTDLRLCRHFVQRHVAVLAQCASLRRLRLYQSPLSLLVSLLMAPAMAQLQSLSLDFCEAAGEDGPDAAAEAWAAIFGHLRCLRSLALLGGNDLEVLWRGVAAAHAAAATAGSRGSSALRAGALQLDEAGGSQLPPLATNCPRRRHLHLHDAAGKCVGSGALDWLVGTPGPTDQPLHSLSDASADAAVGGGGTLRRLHVSHIYDHVLRAALLLPQMRLLETLSMGESCIFKYERKSWECCLNNMRSLRALHVDMSGNIEFVLKVLRRTTPWSLRSLRIRLRRDNRSGSVTIDTRQVADLLDRMPAFTVELLVEPWPDDHSMSPNMKRLLDEWTAMRQKYPARVSLSQPRDSAGGDPVGCWRE